MDSQTEAPPRSAQHPGIQLFCFRWRNLQTTFNLALRWNPRACVPEMAPADPDPFLSLPQGSVLPPVWEEVVMGGVTGH